MKFKLLRMALFGAAAIVAVSSGSAEATSDFKVLHSFAGGDGDGANPYGGVAPDGQGNFYVATGSGGLQNSGTLMFMSGKGVATIIHSFLGNNDGQNPDGTPVISDGYLQGTTRFGGAYGCGTFYRYATTLGYGELPFYCASGQGLAFPFAGYIYDPHDPIATFTNGNVREGGDDGGFSDPSGEFSCQFHGSDGSHPYGGVIEAKFVGKDHAYYVAASAGGSSNLGTVTQFDPDCNVRVLHNFAGGTDGANPYGTLLYNKNFFLFGTTRFGGSPNLGTVFRMDISGGNYTVLHAFQGVCCGNSDGSFPASGLVLNRKDKMYYGTTINGGSASDDGTIYKIDPNTGAESIVHAFTGAEGAHPYAALYIDAKGRIYGTTLQGGADNFGVVFRLKT